jgi:hypothetical protein
MKSLLFFFKYIFFGCGCGLFIAFFVFIIIGGPIDVEIALIFFLPFSILAFILAFAVNISYKELKWNDDFLYLFFMTLSKRRKRKHRALKEKMRQELDN